MSYSLLSGPRGIEAIMDQAIMIERQRCADLVAIYPLDGFCYDINNQGEILRLRDTLSEAILKGTPGERIK
jgi:hypothetical protein